MKKTITGWISRNDISCIEENASFVRPINFSSNGSSPDGYHVTITYDDGKPATKTVWEWMYKEDGVWAVSTALMDEDEAERAFKNFPHKKARSFEVEVEGD